MKVFIKFLLFILIIAALYLGGVIACGYLAKEEYKKLSSNWFHKHPQFEVVEKEDNWGLFSTNVTKEFIEKSNNIRVLVTAKIKHGPVIYENGRFKFLMALIDYDYDIKDESTLAIYKELFGDRKIVEVKSSVSLNGDISTHSVSKPFKAGDADTKIDWKGFNINSNLDKKFTKILSDSVFNGFDLNSSNDELSFNNLKVKFAYKKGKYDLFLGVGDISLEHFNFKVKKSGEDKSLILNGLKINQETDMNGSLLNFKFNLGFDNVKYKHLTTQNIKKLDLTKDFDFSNISFKDFNFNFKVKNLGAEIISKSKVDSYNLGLNSRPELLNFNEFALLEYRPGIEIEKFEVGTDFGKVKISGYAYVGGKGYNENSNLNEIKKSVDLDFNLEIDKKIAMAIARSMIFEQLNFEVGLSKNDPNMKPIEFTNEQFLEEKDKRAKELVESWLKDKLIVEDGDKYKSHIIFKNGENLVNSNLIHKVD